MRENDSQPQSPLGANDECLDAADACTVQVDKSHGPGPSGGGQFWGASSDGSRVFFTDCSQLTTDSTATSSSECDSIEGSGVGLLKTGSDLYEYDFEKPEGERLTDLTVDHEAGGASVLGVIGTSEDGEYVYFVARGALANGATAGQPNLYLRHDGATTFIATLSEEDGKLVRPLGVGTQYEKPNDWSPSVGGRTAQVTANGHAIVFMSDSSVTGYPNEGLEEVYVYETEGGTLTCVSCEPDGSPPPLTEANAGDAVLGAAGYIPVSGNPTYTQRVISEDGSRVFFNSPEPLVPQASDDVGNVYEWERAGTPGGSCPEGAPNGGCVYLLSGGTSTEDSYFFDASASGDDVFMATRAQLVAEDLDENTKVYDVRVDGSRPLAPPACSGTGCQGVPGAPPIFATPSSVTFNGVGNFPGGGASNSPTVVKPKPKMGKCAKGRHLSHGKCVKSRKRAKKAQRVGRDRRTES